MRYLQLVSILLLCGQVLGQPGFNKTYDLNSSGGTLVNGTTNGNMVFLNGSILHDSIAGLQGVGLITADTNGNTTGIYPYFDPGGKDLGVGDNYGVKLLYNGGVVMTGDYFSQTATFTMLFSSNGGLMLFKKFDHDHKHFQNEIIETSDGFLFGGAFAPPIDGILRNYLIKTDKEGNILWEKEYWDDPNLTYNMRSMNKLDENTFVVGSVITQVIPPNMFGWAQSHIFAIDSLGDVKWEFKGPVNDESRVTSVHRLANGNWLYTTLEAVLGSGTIYLPTWTKVVCRDSAWNLVWEKRISPTNWWRNQEVDMKPTPDGNFVVAARWAPGPSPEEPQWIAGCLYKITPEGEEVWQVCDTAYWDVSPVEVEPFVGGLVVLPSGSVVLVGRTDRYQPWPPRSYGWMFKVDANGCMYAPCSVPTEEPSKPAELWAYPNPAASRITVRLPDLARGGQVEVFDTLGRLVANVRTAEAQEAAYFDVSDWSSGVYLLRLVQDGRVLAAGRVVVAW